MRSVESVDDDDCLALGMGGMGGVVGMGGMNNGAMGLRKSTASMSSAMSVSSDQMSTGENMGHGIWDMRYADIGWNYSTATHTLTCSPTLSHPFSYLSPFPCPLGGDLGNDSTVSIIPHLSAASHTLSHPSTHTLLPPFLPLPPPTTLGGDLGNDSTVEESDGAMSEGGGGSTTPESTGYHHHGAHQLISSSAATGRLGVGGVKSVTAAKSELEQQEDSDEVGLLVSSLFVYLFVCLPVCLFACLFVCLSI